MPTVWNASIVVTPLTVTDNANGVECIDSNNIIEEVTNAKIIAGY